MADAYGAPRGDAGTVNGVTRKQRYRTLIQQLRNERSTFDAHWREAARFIKPNRARFLTTDTNKGYKKNQEIIDATGSHAARTLASGMMSGITSPARPWFRLGTPDPELSEYGPVKEYLNQVRQRILDTFNRSNIYNRLQIVYGDLGVFGTGAIGLFDDPDTVIRAYDYPIGSYYLANDAILEPKTFARLYRLTVRQVVERFAQGGRNATLTNCSTAVRSAWAAGNYDYWVDIACLIQPNAFANHRAFGPEFKRYSACYFEVGTMGATGAFGGSGNAPGVGSVEDENTFLEESGYDEFPILAPRWEVAGEDVYGTDCPGMLALADIKQLQTMEKRAAQAVDKMVNPPMIAPAAMRSAKLSVLPGDVSYVDEASDKKFRPAYEVNFAIDQVEKKEEQKREIIRRHFYEDLFLMLEQLDRAQITATEIMERKEEKLLALGPVLEQLNQDLLRPLIDRTFAIMGRRRLLPVPPPELRGQALNVEYESILSQAQKAVGISALERTTTYVSQIAAAKQDPTVFDKLDLDAAIEEYADMAGVAPHLVRPQDAVDQLRDQRQQQQQAQANAEMASKLAPAAAALSTAQAQNSSPGALADLVNGGGGLAPGLGGSGPTQ